MANAGQLVDQLYRLLPVKIRHTLKASLGMAGHGSSLFDGLKAKRDAAGKKRVDRAMTSLTARLRHADILRLDGMKCLEVGTGFVPTDAVCLYLLGAEEIVTTDYNAICQVTTLKTAFQGFDQNELRALATPFTAEFEPRLQSILRLVEQETPDLASLHMKYVAPYDLTKSGFPESSFDLITSVDVLEHIPPSSIQQLLENLAGLLNAKGQMLHEIDLKDHRSMKEAPFDFLSDTTDYINESDSDARGNRLRPQDWMDAFNAISNLRSEIIWREPGIDLPLPDRVLPDLSEVSPADLFCSRLLMHSSRNT